MILTGNSPRVAFPGRPLTLADYEARDMDQWLPAVRALHGDIAADWLLWKATKEQLDQYDVLEDVLDALRPETVFGALRYADHPLVVADRLMELACV